jgi:hypothetical protein
VVIALGDDLAGSMFAGPVIDSPRSMITHF